MLMPLLVRLTDSEIKAVDRVLSQVLNGVQHGGGVLEKVGAVGLPIYQKPLLSDLHIQPVYWDIQSGSQLGRAQRTRVMNPPAAWLAHLDAGSVPDPLHGYWEHLVIAVG
jgi:hypothetical protein